MTTNEHLEHLIELRGTLLREVARLEIAICKERAGERALASAQHGAPRRRADLSWEDALHEAKIPLLRDVLAVHA
jgi:hypothetical protein